jgi:hypothetical protein
MYTLPAAPPPDASVAPESVAALQSAVLPGAVVPGVSGVEDDGDGAADALADALEVAGEGDALAELLPDVVPCGCAWLGPQALSISTAAAAAVVRTNTWEIPWDFMA